MNPTKVSRRTMLLAAAAICSANQATAALSYSSPYRPSETDVKTLPERLYDSRAKESIVRLPSGIEYFDLARGTGAQAENGSQVSVYYTSRLRGLNGIKLDSSYDDKYATPFNFRVGEADVVPGLSEMVVGMQVGGKRRAVLPPSVAYKNADMRPKVKEFFARRRLLSVLETSRDATIVFEYVVAFLSFCILGGNPCGVRLTL